MFRFMFISFATCLFVVATGTVAMALGLSLAWTLIAMAVGWLLVMALIVINALESRSRAD